MFPGHYTEHEIGIGDLLFVDFFPGFFGQSGCTITPGFGDGALIDLADIAEDYVVLMIFCRVPEATVCVFA
jgi:hypothetical protein